MNSGFRVCEHIIAILFEEIPFHMSQAVSHDVDCIFRYVLKIINILRIVASQSGSKNWKYLECIKMSNKRYVRKYECMREHRVDQFIFSVCKLFSCFKSNINVIISNKYNFFYLFPCRMNLVNNCSFTFCSWYLTNQCNCTEFWCWSNELGPAGLVH